MKNSYKIVVVLGGMLAMAGLEASEKEFKKSQASEHKAGQYSSGKLPDLRASRELEEVFNTAWLACYADPLFAQGMQHHMGLSLRGIESYAHLGKDQHFYQLKQSYLIHQFMLRKDEKGRVKYESRIKEWTPSNFVFGLSHIAYFDAHRDQQKSKFNRTTWSKSYEKWRKTEDARKAEDDFNKAVNEAFKISSAVASEMSNMKGVGAGSSPREKRHK